MTTDTGMDIEGKENCKDIPIEGIALEIEDLNKYLTERERRDLTNLIEKIRGCRLVEGKDPYPVYDMILREKE